METTPIAQGPVECRVGRHEPPLYYGYWRYKGGGFSRITRCQACKTTALYEDAHPGNPCKHCGGQVFVAGSGKWVAPVTRWRWFRREIVMAGYWMPPNVEHDRRTAALSPCVRVDGPVGPHAEK